MESVLLCIQIVLFQVSEHFGYPNISDICMNISGIWTPLGPSVFGEVTFHCIIYWYMQTLWYICDLVQRRGESWTIWVTWMRTSVCSVSRQTETWWLEWNWGSPPVSPTVGNTRWRHTGQSSKRRWGGGEERVGGEMVYVALPKDLLENRIKCVYA